MALTRPAGTWTYEDLLSFPDDGKRYEIIEGELYEMPAPSWAHATAVMNLVALLLPVISRMGGVLRVAPLDTFFQGADPVQPDILAILPGSATRGYGRGVEGAPDLAIEVLSPANRAHDLLTKRALYARGGVREYWIVDPANRTVEILVLDIDAFHTRQAVSSGEFTSPLLDGATFAVANVFAGLQESES